MPIYAHEPVGSLRLGPRSAEGQDFRACDETRFNMDEESFFTIRGVQVRFALSRFFRVWFNCLGFAKTG